MSAYPGQDVMWMCSVQSTSVLSFTWFIDGVMVFNEMGTPTGQTVSSNYTLENINYTDSNSVVVMCNASGSSVNIASHNVTLTGNASLFTEHYTLPFHCTFLSMKFIHTYLHGMSGRFQWIINVLARSRSQIQATVC